MGDGSFTTRKRGVVGGCSTRRGVAEASQHSSYRRNPSITIHKRRVPKNPVSPAFRTCALSYSSVLWALAAPTRTRQKRKLRINSEHQRHRKYLSISLLKPYFELVKLFTVFFTVIGEGGESPPDKTSTVAPV